MNAALLLAGGKGRRAEQNTPKQYIRANGRMMLSYAAEPLFLCGCVDEIRIIAEEEWQTAILLALKEDGILTDKFKGFCLPGETRQCSVISGMDGIINARSELRFGDTLLIQDAARPFVTVSLLEKCYQALDGHDGVMPYLPMKDAVYLADAGRVTGRLDRELVVAGQAPELFMLDRYYMANMGLTPEERLWISGAAEPALMAGMDIVTIPGEEANFKVTTDYDLKRFIRIAGGAA